MDLLEWAKTNEFKAMWKATFADAMQMLEGIAQEGAFSKTDHKKRLSHWVLFLDPLPGVRLISVEFPFSFGPPRLYLRVWAYHPQGDAQFAAIEADRFVLGGQALTRDFELPQAEWTRQLEGQQIRGLRHILDISALESSTPEGVGASLHSFAAAFCRYVVRVCVPEAEGTAPEIAPPPASAAPGPSGTPQPDEPEEPDVSDDAPAALLADLAAIDEDPRFEGLAPPMRVALANARIGQGGYRKRMLALWDGRCAVSGCEVEAILTASHAQPWAQCETAKQCLDVYNGLLLSANLDRLFDRGLISFADDGAVLMKPGAAVSDLVPAGGLRFVDPRHLPYLAWHRTHFGFA